MNRLRLSLPAALVVALAGLPVAAPGAATDAREIMQKVRDRDTGKNVIMDMEMILVDARGKQRKRSLKSWRRDAPDNPDDSETIMFFTAPANVKDTGFLTFDYDDPERDDDQWLYLPALKKVKRIAAADKSGSFMGSDFTYADMSNPSLDAYRYELMKETAIDGVPVWQIKATPVNDAEITRTGYTQSVQFVRQDNLVVARAVSWVKKGNKLKYMDVRKLELIDGIWTATEMLMTTRKGKVTEHSSLMRVSNVSYNQELDPELFTTRRLIRGQ